MSYERLLNKGLMPNESEILKAMGEKSSLWLGIHKYIKENYDFTPELIYFTKKYGWTIRYRKSGKTLCYLFPENGAFSILLILGSKEAEKVDFIKIELNAKVKSVFENTEQLHDGRWLWIRVLEIDDITSFKILLAAKRKPNKK